MTPIARNLGYLVRNLNVHQATGLQVGSWWQATGERAASSRLRLPHTRSFTLQPGVLLPRRLADLLPAWADEGLAPLRSFLSEPLFTTLRGTPFVTITHRRTTIFISCLELARAFYFWAGPRIVDFFFYPGSIQDVCYAVEPPTARNRQAARLLLHCRNSGPALHDLPRHFTPEQVAILAELLFNPSFNKSFTELRTQLLTRWTQSAIAQPWLRLMLEKAVPVEANGLAFTYAKRPCFWVTSLLKRGNYFCFRKLTYTALDDHRRGRMAARAAVEAPREGLRAYADWQARPSPALDSDHAGSSLYGTLPYSLPQEEEVTLPTLVRTPKVLTDLLSRATYRHVLGKPTLLSERGRGRDLAVAKVFFHLETDKVTYAWYFQAMVAEFRRAYSVTCLEVNNATQQFGPEICVLPSATGAAYRVGVAELCYQRRYFYFVQVLTSRSRRWAFLFTGRNESRLTPAQVHDLLLAIQRAQDDWKVAKSKFEDRLARKFGDALTIIAHNRLGVVSDAKRCRKDMRAQFKI